MSVTSLNTPQSWTRANSETPVHNIHSKLNIARVVAIQFSYDAVYALDWAAAGLQSHGGKV